MTRPFYFTLKNALAINGLISALVSSLDPTPKRRKRSGDIGADSWFCKLSNYSHRFALEHVQSRDGAQDQENACNVPRLFPCMHPVYPNPNSIPDDRMHTRLLKNSVMIATKKYKATIEVTSFSDTTYM